MSRSYYQMRMIIIPCHHESKIPVSEFQDLPKSISGFQLYKKTPRGNFGLKTEVQISHEIQNQNHNSNLTQLSHVLK